MIVFIEICSFLAVDRLGRTSECYIDVEQNGGRAPLGPPLATPLETNRIQKDFFL